MRTKLFNTVLQSVSRSCRLACRCKYGDWGMQITLFAETNRLFMIPAPEHFVSLLDHLENAGVEVSTLREAITAYLLENNVPLNEHYNFDPVTDHQVFYYRNIIEEFLEILE